VLDNQQFFWCFVGILLQHWGAECIRNDSNATSLPAFQLRLKPFFSLGYRLAQSHYRLAEEFVEVTTLCCLFSNRPSLLAAFLLRLVKTETSLPEHSLAATLR